jgi:hypothetical protein
MKNEKRKKIKNKKQKKSMLIDIWSFAFKKKSYKLDVIIIFKKKSGFIYFFQISYREL